MKRIVSTLLAVVLLSVLCVPALAASSLTMGTGGTSGTYYAYGSVLAQFISDNAELNVTAISTGGSTDNIDQIEFEYAELGFSQSDVAYYAYNGLNFEQFIGKPITSFCALAALYNEAVQLVTCNPEIKSMADLKGKNVSVGSAGSGTYFNALDFLAAYDMTLEDINPQYLSFGDSAEALKDGKIDAAFVVAGAPTPAVTDLCATKGAYLIGLDEEHTARLIEINPAYTKCPIPAGTYTGIDEDTVTVAIKAVVLASKNLSEEDAYTIVSTIFENKDEITSLHAKGAELDAEYASECGIPYHAGAAKYFAEKGIEVLQ